MNKRSEARKNCLTDSTDSGADGRGVSSSDNAEEEDQEREGHDPVGVPGEQGFNGLCGQHDIHIH